MQPLALVTLLAAAVAIKVDRAAAPKWAQLSVARGPVDVARSTATSATIVGVSTVLLLAAQGKPMPVALASARRWASVSAGFAGGRAIGQCYRGTDDKVCRMIGALCGGALGASTLAEVPVRMAAFAAMTYVIETVDASGATSLGELRQQLHLSTPGLEAKKWRYVGNTAAGTTKQKPKVETPRANVFGEPVGAGVLPGSRLERWIDALNRDLGHKE